MKINCQRHAGGTLGLRRLLGRLEVGSRHWSELGASMVQFGGFDGGEAVWGQSGRRGPQRRPGPWRIPARLHSTLDHSSPSAISWAARASRRSSSIVGSPNPVASMWATEVPQAPTLTLFGFHVRPRPHVLNHFLPVLGQKRRVFHAVENIGAVRSGRVQDCRDHLFLVKARLGQGNSARLPNEG